MELNPEHFSYYLIILLIALLFFKEEITPIIKAGLNKLFGLEVNTDKKPTLEDVHVLLMEVKGYGEYMKAHYNDETTENLEKIGENQKEMLRGITKISSHQDDIAEDVEELKQFHKEIEKFGVKVRKNA